MARSADFAVALTGTEEMLRQLFGDDYGTETYRQTIAALRRSLHDDLAARQR